MGSELVTIAREAATVCLDSEFTQLQPDLAQNTQETRMSTGPKLWIVDADPSTVEVYERVFSSTYTTRKFSSFDAFQKALDEVNLNGASRPVPDLVISDFSIGDRHFLSVLGRENSIIQPTFPFMIVSSLDDLDCMRKCFQAGASDYITKPFNESALKAKVERLLRIPFSNGFQIDPVSLTVGVGSKRSAPLTSRELQILAALYQAPGNSMTRKELKQKVWGDIKVNRNTFNVHLFNLRKKISGLGVKIQFTPSDIYTLQISGQIQGQLAAATAPATETIN